MKKILIPVFPGTNCEHESLRWFQDNLETNVIFLNFDQQLSCSSQDLHAILVPGGFSYGDYLRAGAIASRSPAMKFVKKMAEAGVPVLGICNGFQILCESGILPGALIKNITRQHHHFPVAIKIEESYFITKDKNCAWIPKLSASSLKQANYLFSDFLIPMSCGMGNWRPPIDPQERASAEKQAAIFYKNNENGSYNSIAGLSNAKGNVLGIMPHPERASNAILGNTEGLIFLLGLAQSQNIKIKPQSELALFAERF